MALPNVLKKALPRHLSAQTCW